MSNEEIDKKFLELGYEKRYFVDIFDQEQITGFYYFSKENSIGYDFVKNEIIISNHYENPCNFSYDEFIQITTLLYFRIDNYFNNKPE